MRNKCSPSTSRTVKEKIESKLCDKLFCVVVYAKKKIWAEVELSGSTHKCLCIVICFLIYVIHKGLQCIRSVQLDKLKACSISP